MYVTALTDLYREQKALGMNSHPTPREDNVREYLKSLQRRDAQRDRETQKNANVLRDGGVGEERRKQKDPEDSK